MKTEISNTQVAEVTKNDIPVTNSIIKIKDLSEKMIIIRLSIGSFVGTKKDTRASKDMVKSEGTSQEFGYVTKKMLKGESFNKVTNLAQKIRSEFNKMTAPWNRDGEGVCKVTKYLDIKSKLEEMSREYYSAVDALASNYDDLVKEDKAKLGGLYNQSDYPTLENFKSRFYIEIEPKPIEKSDFRSGALSDDEIKSINAQIESRIEKSLAEVQRDNLRRVQEKVLHLFNRVAEKNGKLHESAFTNIYEVIQEARDLNVNEMPELDKMFDTLEANLSKYNADSVRSSSNIRIAAATEAKTALEQINSAMEAFM